MMKALTVAIILLSAACHGEDIDALERQPKLLPYAASDLFPDGRAMRSPPLGAVPRERDLGEAAPDVTLALLQRGRDRFDVVCAACHGIAGDGDSLVARKMSLRAPPSLHEPRLKALTAEAIYRIISDGYGLMPSLTTELRPQDRWAVVAYLRALTQSQSLPFAEAPQAIQRELEASK
jgi:mono/diheme cytochrome c family protein